jgi:hypothetical protein
MILHTMVAPVKFTRRMGDDADEEIFGIYATGLG